MRLLYDQWMHGRQCPGCGIIYVDDPDEYAPLVEVEKCTCKDQFHPFETIPVSVIVTLKPTEEPSI